MDSQTAKEKKRQRRNERERARRAAETAAEKEERRRKRRKRDGEKKAAQTEEQKQARLQRKRSREQARLEAEDDEEREARHMRRRQRLAAESVDQREAQLEGLRTNRSQRLATESVAEREARLERQRERLATESLDQREARLEGLGTNQSERLVTESTDQRERRLRNDRENHQSLEHGNTHLSILEQPEIRSKMQKFHESLSNLEIAVCSTCRKGFPGLKINSKSGECRSCSLDKKSPKLYSADNNMNPGPVPPELQGLTQVEEMLISAVLPIMTLYRLPHGQYGYSGHVVNLPQDVASFANSLPCLPSNLDVIVVRKEGTDQSHRDFRVRRSRVLTALQWLRANNIYYRNVHINPDSLALLPEDGNLSGLTSVVESNQSNDEAESSSTLQDDDPYNAYLARTFVPLSGCQQTEQETIRHSVLEQQPSVPPTVTWPAAGAAPINEFNTEGYISCAFPTLFPTGAADFLAPRPCTVTAGNYFKHLMMFEDGRFARHPRFRYLALNSEMRWCALETGRIYVRQHHQDAQLSVQELRDMVGRDGEVFSNRVLHFAASLRGTRQYWFRQRSHLIAMVSTLGLPTIFFTHSAADLQWPELANLICPDDPNSSSSRNKALQENPALSDWFFYHRIDKFIDAFYVGVLGATDYWLRFEWQHRGSPHVHGLAWLSGAPDAEKILSATTTTYSTDPEELLKYVDSIVTTVNPAILPDGSNADDAPSAQTNPHICNKPYNQVEDINQDLKDLVATCQRHTRCSASYCLRTRNGQQKCRFGYPKPLQPTTTVVNEEGEAVLFTKRNDQLLNSFNPVQLSAWRANVDMQYCLSRQKVVEYCAKYATKSEPRSQTLKEVFSTIVRNLSEESSSLKAVQKLIINSIGERDYSAQETCHILLQLPMYRASRDFVVLSLDGSRAVEQQLHEDQPATTPSTLDHYIRRPSTDFYNDMTLMKYTQQYTNPKELGSEPAKRKKDVIVIVRPYCSPDPNGPKYEQYCQQKMMLYKPFRQVEELLQEHETFSNAYAHFLQSGNVPSSLEDDIHRLEQNTQHCSNSDEDSSQDRNEDIQQPIRVIEEWMLVCQRCSETQQESNDQAQTDWSRPSRAYPNIQEMPSFISRQRQSRSAEDTFSTTADPQQLQGKQLQAYTIVYQHVQDSDSSPLRMVISGTAGTGKSYLINCLRLLLQDKLRVAAPTGVAAFNVDGVTLHSLLNLPTRGDYKDLTGEHLHKMQQKLAGMKYLIIDEMSMVGRKIFGQIDKRLRQVFPHSADQLFGGCSCLLFGDFGQLPPVMDLPLYTTMPRTHLSDLGSTAYHIFDRAVVLNQVMRQSGDNPDQVLFRDILLRLRNGQVTIEDWKHLMKQTPAQVQDITPFRTALCLHPTVEAVVEHNVAKLRANNNPIAAIKAVHTGPNASKASPDDAAGLEATVCLADNARVMLTSNLWTEVGLVNGAMGTIKAICYQDGKSPPDLPTAITVKFDTYSGPTLMDGTVPIVPIRRTWSTAGAQCSRLQLPLKLAWAVTIHKAQGLTLDKVVINVGKKEFSSGLTFVACSRVRHLTDLLFDPPFPFQRIANLSKSQRLQERLAEDSRLLQLQ